MNNNMKDKLKKVGYEADETLAKKIAAFEKAASLNSRVPAMLLTGVPGAGKTYLAESFASVVDAELLFVQMTADKDVKSVLVEDIDITAVIREDADHAVSEGILRQAVRLSKDHKVVVCLDEWDKTPSSADSFLLDFLQSGRLTNGHSVEKARLGNLWVILTSNGRRDFPQEFMRRVRNIELDRMPKEAFLNELGLPQEHYLGRVYDAYPEFVLAQAQEYLADICWEIGEEAFDADLLSQYVPELDASLFQKPVRRVEGDEDVEALREYFKEDGNLNVIFKLPYDTYFKVSESKYGDEVQFFEGGIVPMSLNAYRMLYEEYPNAKRKQLSCYLSYDLAICKNEIDKVLAVGDKFLAMCKGSKASVLGQIVGGYFVASCDAAAWKIILGNDIDFVNEESEYY